MLLAEAKNIAEKYLAQLEPYCERIYIAGSIRREKPEPRDIELVCIPKKIILPPSGFFDEGDKVVHPEFCKIVNSWEKVKGEPTGKYTQRILPEGMKLDLFIANEYNHGAILLIRTGDFEFSKKFMGNTIRKNGYVQEEGFLKKNGTIIPVLEEEDLFKLMNIDYIEPKNRNINAL